MTSNTHSKDKADNTGAIESKWNRRYQEKLSAGKPCWVLENNQHLLPASGKCLDFACGLGANALLLASLKLDVHAWDISATALYKLNQFANEKNTSVQTLKRDIENAPPDASSFDVIVVSQFLYRPVFPQLIAALKPDGLLFYQTFNSQKISDRGPSSSDFLLAPGELLSLCSTLDVVFYREDGRIGDLQKGLRDCSYIIGKKG